MHGFLPVNEQERRMRALLEELGVAYKGHEVFAVAFNGINRTLVVDAFLPGPWIVVECWMSESKRANALSWVARNAAAVDVRFARLKGRDRLIRCLGLVEAPQADYEELASVVGPVMGHADFMAYSTEELEETLRKIMARKR
jgi:hypothetical protein